MRERISLTAAATVFAALIGTYPANAAPLPATVDLLAGQFLDVGNVTIQDNGGILEVIIQIDNPAPDDQDWCLQAVHIEVADSESNIPQNNKGNPKIGQFDVNDDVNCSTMETYSFGPTPTGNFVVAVHTVVEATCDLRAILYGTLRATGEIDKIDVINDVVTPVAQFADPAPGNENSPNGLGYDPINDLLYFSATDGSPSDLYSVTPDEFSPGTVVITNLGALTGESAGATFNAGNYWYVLNEDDDLQQVTFGPFNESTNRASFSGANLRTLRFGDIAFKPNSTVLVGSSLGSGGSTELFFSLNTSDGTYTELCSGGGSNIDDCAGSLQISFGSNGVLYGHSTGGAEWFEIDPDTGLITDNSLPITSAASFTDLASGALCVANDQETAWGAGTSFASDTSGNGKRNGSWATYIEIEN